MFQPLSPPLQRGIRFFRHHLPAGHSAFVAIGLPSLAREDAYGLTKFRKHDFVRFRTRLSTGGATSVYPFPEQG
jgi:hypothetical protein